MDLSGKRGRLPCLLHWPPRHDDELVEHTVFGEPVTEGSHEAAAIRIWKCRRCGREKVSSYLSR
jgi:hypothetical protein